jgi:hypothetical protein
MSKIELDINEYICQFVNSSSTNRSFAVQDLNAPPPDASATLGGLCCANPPYIYFVSDAIPRDGFGRREDPRKDEGKRLPS